MSDEILIGEGVVLDARPASFATRAVGAVIDVVALSVVGIALAVARSPVQVGLEERHRRSVSRIRREIGIGCREPPRLPSGNAHASSIEVRVLAPETRRARSTLQRADQLSSRRHEAARRRRPGMADLGCGV